MYLVMELCDGGELSTLLCEHGPFSEDETKVVVEQLARAISYLHRNGTDNAAELCAFFCFYLRQGASGSVA